LNSHGDAAADASDGDGEEVASWVVLEAGAGQSQNRVKPSGKPRIIL
jgi:hypothetical protein